MDLFLRLHCKAEGLAGFGVLRFRAYEAGLILNVIVQWAQNPILIGKAHLDLGILGAKHHCHQNRHGKTTTWRKCPHSLSTPSMFLCDVPGLALGLRHLAAYTWVVVVLSAAEGRSHRKTFLWRGGTIRIRLLHKKKMRPACQAPG